MSDLNSPADLVTEETDATEGSDSKAKSPLEKLSHTLRKRALDLVAIGIVIAATLTLGRQMAAWWNTDPNSVSPFSNSARLLAGSERMWTDADQPVSIEFGGVPYHMQREKVVGKEEKAVDRLIHRAITHSLTNKPLKQTHSSYTRLLESINNEQPAKSEKNVDVFVLRGPAPIIVGTKRDPESSKTKREVVCWGLYYPSQQNEWTTWLFSRSSDEGKTENDRQRPGKLESILPEESKTIMALRTAQGGAILHFQSDLSLGDCQIHFDRVLEKTGWKSIQRWEHRGNMTLNSYELRGQSGTTETTSTSQRNHIIGRIDIQLSETNGKVTGIIYRITH